MTLLTGPGQYTVYALPCAIQKARRDQALARLKAELSRHLEALEGGNEPKETGHERRAQA